MSNLTDHLEFLFKDDSGYVYSPVKQKDGKWVQRFYNWPLERGNLEDWITSNSLESDVYLSPVLFKEKKVSNDSISHSNVVWIEFDGKQSISWQDIPEPDLIVQTSAPNHLHCYWQVPPITDPTVIEDTNRRLTYFLGADGSGWDAVQVLRPPDTINYKHGVPTKLVKLAPVGYDLSAFDKAPKIERPPEVFVYEDLLDVDQIIKANGLPIGLIKLIKSEIVLHPHRSEFLMKLGYELAEAGLDPLEIVSCLYTADSRIKKFVGRSDQLKRLSEIASIALFKSEQSQFLSVYSPQDILSHTVDLKWVIPGILHSTGFVIISGQPGVGKTQMCFDWAYRLSVGSEIFGRVLDRPYKVGFLSLEMDVVELKYIFEHQAKAFDSKNLWNSNLFVLSPDLDQGLDMFVKTIEDLNPDVIFIDSLSELATDDLKESEARQIVRELKRIRKTCNVGLVLIHHNRKASDGNKKPRKLGDLYGSYIFGKATDAVYSLWQEDPERNVLELDALKVRFGKQSGFKIKRTEHLTFELVSGDTTNVTTVEPTTGTVSLKFS